jgi:hypothetical protein
MAHEHGPHICYCPNCSKEVEVAAWVPCNTQTCPLCGTRMRAKETGEYRISNVPATISTMVKTANIPCPVCGYPIPAPLYVGEEVKCAWCNSISTAIEQEGVTIPKTVFWSLLTFGLGVLLGPAIWATTQGGSEWLARKARERLAR